MPPGEQMPPRKQTHLHNLAERERLLKTRGAIGAAQDAHANNSEVEPNKEA